jgi:hypothetical protein
VKVRRVSDRRRGALHPERLSAGGDCRETNKKYWQPNLELLSHDLAASFWTCRR